MSSTAYGRTSSSAEEPLRASLEALLRCAAEAVEADVAALYGRVSDAVVAVRGPLPPERHHELALVCRRVAAEGVTVQEPDAAGRVRLGIPCRLGTGPCLGVLCLLCRADAADPDDPHLADLAAVAAGLLGAHAPTPRVTDALEAERDFTSQALDALPDLFFVFDTEGRPLRWNRQLSRASGYADAEIARMRVFDFFAPADADRVAEAIRDARDTGEAEVEVDLLTKGGQRVPHAFRGSRLVGRDGRLQGICGTGRDVSMHRSVEQALEQINVRFHALAANVPGVVYQLRRRSDGEVRFTYVSPGARRILGLEPEALQSDARLIFDAVHPDDRTALRGAIREAIASGEPWRWQGRVVTDAGERWLLGVSRPRPDGEGSTVWDGVLEDITEQKVREAELIEAKERAEEMNRLKTTFLANMSHEIRTPLTTIIGFAEVLGENVAEEDRDFAQLIEHGGRRLMNTLNAVLDLAQLESGTMRLERRSVDLCTSVLEAAEFFHVQALDKSLDLQLCLPETPVFACASRMAVDRILNNLLSNAIKFTDEGRVTVSVVDGPEAVELVVQDTGIGISPSFLPDLFAEFKQESSGTTRDYAGTGLGLTITKRLVDLMHGQIEVESRKGAGTTFVVRLARAGDGGCGDG